LRILLGTASPKKLPKKFKIILDRFEKHQHHKKTRKSTQTDNAQQYVHRLRRRKLRTKKKTQGND